MTRRIPSPFIAPDADPNDAIVGMEYDSGALHEIIVQGSEARFQITKIVRPAAVHVTPQPNVVAWTNLPRITSTPTDTDYWFTAAFGNSVFVMTSAAGNIGRSTDGTVWTDIGTITTTMGMGDVMCLHFAAGFFVAVGNRFGNAPMAYSTDGATWTSVAAPFGATDLACVGYNNGTWLALGTNGNAYTAPAPNGTWTLAGTSVYPYAPSTMMPTKLISFNNQWVGVGDHNRSTAIASNFFVGGTPYVVSSFDGTVWVQAAPPDATRLVDIATDGTRVVVVDCAGIMGYKYSSSNLIQWSKSGPTFNRATNLGIGSSESPLTNVAHFNNTWVATTYNGFTLFSSNSYDWTTDDYNNNTFVNLPQGTMAVGLNMIVQGGWWKQTVSLVDYGFVQYTVTTPAVGQPHPEYPLSFGSIPQLYDPVTDMLYVLHTMTKRIGTFAFATARLELLKIDPRSKQVVDDYLIYERDPLATSGSDLTFPMHVQCGNGTELHLQYFDQYSIRRDLFIDPSTMTEIVRIASDTTRAPYFHVPVGGNKYAQWDENTSSPTVYMFERTPAGDFVQTGSFPVALSVGSLAGVYHAADPSNNILWLITRSSTDDGATVGQSARIAARIDTTTNSVTYINKADVPLSPGNNSYVTRDPEVVNGRLTFNTKRSNGGDQVHGLTVVTQDGLTVTRYGEYDTNYTFGDSNGPIRVTYDGQTGYATDFWDNNALLVWDLTQPSHVRYDQYLYTANTAGLGTIASGDTGQGTYASPRSTLINWTGTYSGVVGIPANGRVVSAPTYNRTPPTVVDTLTPPAPGVGLLTNNYEFDYPGTGSLVPVNWHAIVHDGVTRKNISFLQPDDQTTNDWYGFLVAGQIECALYTPNGRLFGRIRRGETEMYQSGYTRAEQTNLLEQYGFVIPASMPAGTYYIGVLPYYNEQYNGRTVFSDYEFDGYTADPSTENPGTQPTIKYRIRVQTTPNF